MKSSRSYVLLGLCCQLLVVGSLATTESPVKAMQMQNVEESTVSPLSVMSEMDEPHMKTSTERPPVVKSPEPEMESKDPTTTPRQSVRKTVGDFIIHPLIAFKPRTDQVDDDDTPLGKQAPGSTSNSTSPWSLFAFNAGQGFGSSVSSLAGSVSSWLGQRIPVLVETPVRETTTTTTTTTTPRPDIIVRVQHKPSRKPLIAINNQNRPHSLGNNNNLDLESDELEDDINANRFGNIDDYDEEDEEDYVSGEDSAQQEQPQKKKQKQKKKQQAQPAAAASEESAGQSDEEPEVTNEVEEDEDDEDIVQRPPVANRKRPLQNQRRRVPVSHNRVQQQRRRVPAGNRRLRPQQYEEVYYEDVEEDDDEVDDDEDAQEVNDNDRFYYGNKYSSSRRSQSQPNFIQRGQQSLIKQIRQFTRGRTPAEMAAATRKGQKGASGAAQPQRRRQGTLFVNRNGQPVYVAPQLQQQPQQQQFYIHEAGAFPQPPLTTPIKRKGRPTQYITIPWSQLGIQPPTQIVGVAEGLQQQPLIFRMPPNAVAGMQGQRKQKRPMITADAVPLLAEASLMDIFKPPKIPASRSGSKPVKQNENHGMNRLRPSAPQRIKSGTIVEKAPANSDEQQMMEQQQAAENSEKQMMNSNNEQQEFIMVGEDDESGVARQAQAIFGESRFFGRNPIIEALGNGRFAVRKGGRALETEQQEQQIPVQIVVDGEEEKVFETKPESEVKVAVETVEAPVKPVEVVADTQPLAVEPIVVPEAVPVASTPVEEQSTV